MSEQGTWANSSGNTLEKTVIATLHSKGFEVLSYKEWQKNPERYGGELLLRNVPFVSIYGHQGKTEFLILSKRLNLEIRIECKWQQSAGSVDEKFPYLYLNCIEAMPQQKIFIIVDGQGAKPKAIEWLRKSCEEKRYNGGAKIIQVMNLSQFLVWANTTLR